METKKIEVEILKNKVDLISNITYSQPVDYFGKNIKLEMDILRPSVTGKYPTLIFVTGGGFAQSIKERMIQQRMELVQEGYVVASIQYRVIPNGMFPDSVEDVKSAIRFLKANSDLYNVDKEKIAVIGDSAGGYLAAFTGVTNGIKKFDKGENLLENSDVKAIIDIYGITDFEKIYEIDKNMEINEEYKLLFSAVDIWLSKVKNDLKQTNPIQYISEKTPPFLLMHGDKDTLVPEFHTEILHKALVEKGVNSTRYLIKDAPHAGYYWLQPKILEIIKEFLEKNLKNK